MKRKLKKPVTLAHPTPAVHKRLSNDLLRNAMVAPIEVDDPGELVMTGSGFQRAAPEGKIIVMRSLRCDPLTRMHAHGGIDDAQFAAGQRWQEYYELTEIGGARAIDFTKEAVDGGGFRDNRDSDGYNKAIKELSRVARAVGMLGEQCLKDVLANRMFLNQVAAMRNITPEEASKRFRTALEIVTMEYGFTMRGATTSEQGART